MKMSAYASDREEEDREYEGPDQEREDQGEASNLVAFVVLCLVIGVASGWAGILSGRI